MDITGLYQKSITYIKKYKYVALVLLIGVALMVFPTKGEESNADIPAEQVRSDPQMSVQLENLLSKVSGAGEVSVMLTVATGEETIYQTNDDVSTADNVNQYQKDTVTITDADRNQKGLVKQVNPPTYLGAIVVCRGADDPAVRLAIVNAVSKVTGLGADRIAVLKMK